LALLILYRKIQNAIDARRCCSYLLTKQYKTSEDRHMSTNEKVAFITGGNRGIGLETARELGGRGYRVVIGVRAPAGAESALQTLRAAGVQAEAVHYDAEKPATDQGVFDHLSRRYGKLDVLVNNAALATEVVVSRTVLTVSQEDLERTFAVNLFAVVRLTRKLLPLIEKAEAGRIVNVSSVLGSLGVHSAPSSPLAQAKPFAYDASKTALNAFTVHLAAELAGTRIKVNSVHPGWVKTEIGGPHATDEVTGSAATSVRLATIGSDGPNGGFFHREDALPW
jgi:NAD(P)-dependent dehydrogenase (short-subunit alcohol dehydrogenase family)